MILRISGNWGRHFSTITPIAAFPVGGTYE